MGREIGDVEEACDVAARTGGVCAESAEGEGWVDVEEGDVGGNAVVDVVGGRRRLPLGIGEGYRESLESGGAYIIDSQRRRRWDDAACINVLILLREVLSIRID